MPTLYHYHCNSCDFQLPTGWGSTTYAVDESGKRVRCPHPEEVTLICKVTGLGLCDALKQGRAGAMSDCICLECFHHCKIDLKWDQHQCPSCAGTSIITAYELVGEQCPQCKDGNFIRTDTNVRCQVS